MSFFSLSKIQASNFPTRLITDYAYENIDKCLTHWHVHPHIADAVDRLYAIETRISDEEFNSSDFTSSLTEEQRVAINTVHYSMEDIRSVVCSLRSDRKIVEKMSNQKEFLRWLDLLLITYIKTRQVSAAQIASWGLIFGGLNQLLYNRQMNLIYPGSCPSVYTFPVPRSVPLPVPQIYRIDTAFKYIQKSFRLSDSAMKRLLESLKRKPLSEKYYLTIEMPVGPGFLLSQGHQWLMNRMGFLKPVEEEVFEGAKRTVMVIPSFSMLEECARHYFPDDAVPMMPLVGRCGKEEITKYTLQGRCVFQVGTSKAHVSATTGNIYGELNHGFHDYSRLVRKAMMGASGQRAVCYLIGCVFAKNITNATEGIRWRLTDGELHTRYEPFGTIFYCLTVPWDTVHVEKVVKNMAAIPEFWRDAFGFTPNQLTPRERMFYNAFFPKITEKERALAKKDVFLYFQRYTHHTNPFANFRLALLYFDGYGTERCYLLAKKHFALSGKLGYARLATHYRDGLGCEKNLRRAVYYFDLAAKNGDCSAMNQLAKWHFFGHEDIVAQDYSEAMRYFGKAAAKKDACALRSLGMMLQHGFGIEKNSKEAFIFFKEAADLGDSDAQLQLANWYRSGYQEAGVIADKRLALLYLSKAVQLGNVTACRQLGVAYRDGIGCETSLQIAFTYFMNAAKAGDEESQNELGTWYFNGVEGVVTKNLEHAAHYFQLAAHQGNQKAIANLKIVQETHS